jgi:HlyD family secretion protein
MYTSRYLPGLAILVFAIGCGKSREGISGSGFIETDEILVSAETNGQVKQLFVDEGSRVTAGDTLAIIDPSRLELQLKTLQAGRKVAQANLQNARIQLQQATESEAFAQTEFERVSKLLSSGTATQKQFDQAQHEHTQAKLATQRARAAVHTIQAEIDKTDAEIARTQRELQDCWPLAPVSGDVTEDFIDAGELATTGAPLVKIARLDTIWVKIYLTAGDFAHVQLGDTATVDTEAGDMKYTGRVIWTADEAEFTPKNVQTEESRSGLVYAVKVQIANPDNYLKVGMPVFVTLKKS